MKTLINQVKWFNGRIGGYEVWESTTGEVFGMTDSDVTKALKSGEKINGLVLGAKGPVLDKEGFLQSTVMIRTTLTNMKPESESCPANILYTLVEVKNADAYVLINSRYGISTVSANKLKALAEIGLIQGGCKLDSKGEVVIAKCLKPASAKEVKKS